MLSSLKSSSEFTSDKNSSSLIAVVTEGVEGAAVAGVETFLSCLASGSGSAAFLFLDKSTVVIAESCRCLDGTKQRCVNALGEVGTRQYTDDTGLRVARVCQYRASIQDAIVI